mgnify:FL=1
MYDYQDLRISFNPRARVGRDPLFPVVYIDAKDVSIHAPAWGATYAVPLRLLTFTSFNPRARVGRDDKL